MKRILIPLLAALAFLGPARSARADYVDRLVSELRTNPSYKVRLTAVLGLAKYADPRVEKALIAVLKKDSEDPKVRGFAAMALGRLRTQAAIPALQKATRASDSFLKGKAKWALEKLCPSSLSGKRIYINLDKFKASGPAKHLARGIALVHLTRVLSGRADVTMGWPKCRKPSARDLKRKRLKGYFFDTSVKVTESGGKVKIKVSVLFTTYPDQSIKGNAGASAAVPGSATNDVLSNLIEALVGAIRSDISRFLDSQ